MEAEVRFWSRQRVWVGWGQLIWLLIFLWAACCSGATYVGVCYGRDAYNLPSPQKVVQLLQAQAIPRVRLFDADPAVLGALANTQIEVVVGVTNLEIADIAQSEAVGYAWVNKNIVPYVPATSITAIAVGSEVITSPLNLSLLLVQAMRNLNAGLINAGLDKHIKVSTPHAMGVVERSFPPSAATFDTNFVSILEPMLEFLSQTQSFFMVNVYPFYTYRNENPNVLLDYALFQPRGGLVDSKSGLIYFNLFDAQVDAVFYAMQALGYYNLNVVVTETGWPSMGEALEVDVVNFKNAATYNNNLISHILNKTGTPMKPGIAIDTYIFELFNEDLRPGPTSVRNWGLFRPDGTKMYDFSFGQPGIGVYGGISPPGNGRGIPIINRTFCIATPGAIFTHLQISLDWVCGPGHADCDAIQPGKRCYLPDTVTSHASYAFNNYYQSYGMDPNFCNFSGVSSITSIDPSYAQCIYEGSYSSSGRLSYEKVLWALQLLVFIMPMHALQ
ncbi:hypothetical protein O6H91_16G095200 [Diphasiastrum complanatum]|uniref:Uncharacterized protein n=1 Tax=Diphasiastrum complanatum TaxID=34168 RepID=A0ACC2BES3_DIPCM|nr:hypothetical protein O6H91_Y432900 [Diphasiastrum complanatum]KAJ7528343.1 hypothetical protein O6H91_16G095200 [Diphasiastrum complanatum]